MTIVRSPADMGVILAEYFDHTNLRAELGPAGVENLCREAIEYQFHGVCVNPTWVKTAAELVAAAPMAVVCVAGFPMGANRTDTKLHEVSKALEDGATEIDMVANIGWLKAGLWAKAAAELDTIVRTLPASCTMKIIIEASLLSPDRQIKAVEVVADSGASFVKTGTGATGPVTVEQVLRLAKAASGRLALKAAGGIRSRSQCHSLMEAGAKRLGSSSSVEIMREALNCDS